MGCFGAIRADTAGLSPEQLAAASRLAKILARVDRCSSDVMGLVVGLNSEKGCFGRVGHNGVVLVGPLGAALSGAALLCKITEAAQNTQKCDIDAWANAFCREVFPKMRQDKAAARRQDLAEQWLRDKRRSFKGCLVLKDGHTVLGWKTARTHGSTRTLSIEHTVLG